MSRKQKYYQFFKKIISLPLVVIDWLVILYSRLVSYIQNDFGFIWLDKQSKKNSTLTQKLDYPATHEGNEKKQLRIYTPNWICRYRSNTFASKEPETIAWINAYGDQGAFFDIGANVGLYSLYFAETKPGAVYSFEPSVFNLALLAKNINLNKLTHKIKVLPLALAEKNSVADFSLTTTEEGGALSSFGVDYGYDGQALHKTCSYQTLGLSLDFMLDHKLLPEPPALIKLDVDGIEHLILAGAVKTLSRPECRSVLVEVSENFALQREKVSSILRQCGFVLQAKERSLLVCAGDFSDAYNQIWVKEGVTAG